MNDPQILGIGTDIIEVERVKNAIERHGQHFLDRLFTLKEQQYAFARQDSHTVFAGRFAAKEAIAKAFGTGIGAQIGWQDIEIINNSLGRPEVSLSSKVRDHFGKTTVYLSISHCKDYAVAFVLVSNCKNS